MGAASSITTNCDFGLAILPSDCKSNSQKVSNNRNTVLSIRGSLSQSNR